jgi:hypothetical protein
MLSSVTPGQSQRGMGISRNEGPGIGVFRESQRRRIHRTVPGVVSLCHEIAGGIGSRS